MGQTHSVVDCNLHSVQYIFLGISKLAKKEIKQKKKPLFINGVVDVAAKRSAQQRLVDIFSSRPVLFFIIIPTMIIQWWKQFILNGVVRNTNIGSISLKVAKLASSHKVL